jgi:hypothetical protein
MSVMTAQRTPPSAAATMTNIASHAVQLGEVGVVVGRSPA